MMVRLNMEPYGLFHAMARLGLGPQKLQRVELAKIDKIELSTTTSITGYARSIA